MPPPRRPMGPKPLRPRKDTAITLYRKDNRPPDVIKQDGFDYWGEAYMAVRKAGGIAPYIREACRRAKNGKTFADWVRGQSSTARPSISTLKFQNIYVPRDYIYTIEYPFLPCFDLDQRIMPNDEPLKQGEWRSDGLKVYMDGCSLKFASVILIDLRLAAQEWDFFTKVPPRNITAWMKTGTDLWTSMW